ncbi:hypothetical protein K470DRAFT_289506 [Piedraia hortae CBS 480.64]|uniref:Uncharacterized protein n=1 Tax=Piedraia hortae CBS 480.64 TaxID=1314780 RepID=A0A6A7BT64_9PEZI|nr:hypothetical protein K470DRAFT_289506 [Piedraia hortae CBS 480.64]
MSLVSSPSPPRVLLPRPLQSPVWMPQLRRVAATYTPRQIDLPEMNPTVTNAQYQSNALVPWSHELLSAAADVVQYSTSCYRELLHHGSDEEITQAETEMQAALTMWAAIDERSLNDAMAGLERTAPYPVAQPASLASPWLPRQLSRLRRPSPQQINASYRTDD